MSRRDKTSLAGTACELERKAHLEGSEPAQRKALSLRRLITRGCTGSVSEADLETLDQEGLMKDESCGGVNEMPLAGSSI